MRKQKTSAESDRRQSVVVLRVLQRQGVAITTKVSREELSFTLFYLVAIQASSFLADRLSQRLSQTE